MDVLEILRGVPLAMLASTVVDLLAVGALAYLLLRSRRDHDASLAEQRGALERLKGDLAQLLDDAERRTRVLEEVLAARERGLRQLLGDMAAIDGPPEPVRRSQTRPPLVRDLAPEDVVAGDRPRADPAEMRLLRDLQLSLGRSRAEAGR